MAFWKDLTTTLTDAVDSTVKGAEKLAGQAKLKYQISIQKRKLESTFTSIGKMSYEAYQKGIDHPDEAEEAYQKVNKLLSAISQLEAELAKTADCKICPVCGEKLSKETIYCHQCGSKQNTDE